MKAAALALFLAALAMGQGELSAEGPFPLLLAVPLPLFGWDMNLGATLARDFVNEHPNLPNITLRWLNTSCNEIYARDSLLEALTTNSQFAGLIHASCSGDLWAFHSLLDERSLFTLSISGSSPIRLLPPLPRSILLLPALDDALNLWMLMLEKSKLRRVAVYERSPYIFNAGSILESRGFQVLHNWASTSDTEADRVAFARKVFYSGVNVVILSATHRSAASMMCAFVDARSLTNSTLRVQYLSQHASRIDWISGSLTITCDRDLLDKELENFWHLNRYVEENGHIPQFSSELNFTALPVETASYYVYDAVIAFSLGLKRALANGSITPSSLADPLNQTASEALKAALSDVEFVGASGNVSVDSRARSLYVFRGDKCLLRSTADGFELCEGGSNPAALAERFLDGPPPVPIPVLIVMQEADPCAGLVQNHLSFQTLSGGEIFTMVPRFFNLHCDSLSSLLEVATALAAAEGEHSLTAVSMYDYCNGYVSASILLSKEMSPALSGIIGRPPPQVALDDGGSERPLVPLLRDPTFVHCGVMSLVHHYNWHRVAIISHTQVLQDQSSYLSMNSLQHKLADVGIPVVLNQILIPGEEEHTQRILDSIKSLDIRIIILFMPFSSDEFSSFACSLFKAGFTAANGYVYILPGKMEPFAQEWRGFSSATCTKMCGLPMTGGSLFDGWLGLEQSYLNASFPLHKAVDDMTESCMQEFFPLIRDGIDIIAFALKKVMGEFGVEAVDALLSHTNNATLSSTFYRWMGKADFSGASGRIYFNDRLENQGTFVKIMQFEGNAWLEKARANESGLVGPANLTWLSGKVPTAGAPTTTIPGWVYALIFGSLSVAAIAGAISWYLVSLSRSLQKARLIAEAANSAKTVFLRNVSHDIRSPLNGACGMSELLERTSLDAQQSSFLDAIRGSLSLLTEILTDILDLSKIESGRIVLANEPFQPHECIEKSLELAAIAAGVVKRGKIDTFYTVSGSAPRMVTGDVNRVQRILMNLLGNSFKFTEAGSISIHLDVLTGATDAHKFGRAWSKIVNASSSSKAEYPAVGPFLWKGDATQCVLLFSVSDTGMGVPVSEQPKLFQAFYQVDGASTRQIQRGTGLGLSICKNLSQLMGGHMWLKSEVNVGSCFLFSIVAGLEEPPTPAPVVVSMSPQAALSPPDGIRSLIKSSYSSMDSDMEKVRDAMADVTTVILHSSEGMRRSVKQLLLAIGVSSRKVARASAVAKALRGCGESVIVAQYPLPGFWNHVAPLFASENCPKLILLLREPGAITEEDTDQFAHLRCHRAILVQPVKLASLVRVLSNAELDSIVADKQELLRASLEEHALSLKRPLEVVVVEDNPLNRKVLGLFLKTHLSSVSISTAENGLLGRGLLLGRFADVAFCDISMPVKNGLEMAREFCQIRPIARERPVLIALTANATLEDKNVCFNSGFDDFISKPVSINDILQALVKWMPSILRRNKELQDSSSIPGNQLVSLLQRRQPTSVVEISPRSTGDC